MSIKNRKSFILVIFIIILGIFIVLTIKNHLPYPENQFGIVGDEAFKLTHCYNVNGVVGAEKTKFSAGETQKIMGFLATLQYKETLPLEIETIYGFPVHLEVKKQNGTQITFLFFSDIEALEYDKNNKIISRKCYTIDEKQRKTIEKIIGIVRE